MMHTEIAFAHERAIIANMLVSLLTNVRSTYLPDLEPADAHELLFTGAHVLIAQLGSQQATAAEISRVIGRQRDVVSQRLDELMKRGFVERSGNRYKIPRHRTCRTRGVTFEATSTSFGPPPSSSAPAPPVRDLALRLEILALEFRVKASRY